MKHKAFYLLLLLTVSLIACRNSRRSVLLPELAEAEAVMYAHPDSALHILQRMNPPRNRFQNAVRCLLLTHAQYKCMMPLPSDSVVAIAYDYLKHTDDHERKALAAYCRGIVNAELKCPDEATKYYLEAGGEVEKTKDVRLGYLIQLGLCKVYAYRDLERLAWESAQKAYAYAMQDSTKKYVPSILKYWGRVYSINGDYPRAIEVYRRAAHVADSLKQSKQTYAINNELAGMYLNKGQEDEALKLVQELIAIQRKKKLPVAPQTMYILGTIYLHSSQLDSAHYYLNQSLQTIDAHVLSNAYAALLNLSIKQKRMDQISNYHDSLLKYQEMVHEIDKKEAIINYQDTYKQETLINANQKLQIRNRNLILISICIGVILLVASGVYQWMLRKRRTILREKEEELRRLNILSQEKQELITKNKANIAELESVLEQLYSQIEKLRKQQDYSHEQNRKICEELYETNEALQLEINSFTAKLQQQISSTTQIIKELLNEQEQMKEHRDILCGKILKESELLKLLHKTNKILTIEQQAEVMAFTDQINYRFCERLRQYSASLSDRDLLVCCLIKLHFSVSKIADLLCTSSNTISCQKQRIKEKIALDTQKPFPSKTLDLWLLDEL